jgi:hypothetical protein
VVIKSVMCVKPENTEGGFVQVVLFLVLILFVAVIGVPYFIFGKVVPPNYIGVRQNYFEFSYLLKKGFEDEGLEPGLHWTFPRISSVILLPRDFQFIEYREGQGAYHALDIPTTDGSKVRTDVTIALRLYDESGVQQEDQVEKKTEQKGIAAAPIAIKEETRHGGPRELIYDYTANPQTVLASVSKTSENYLKRELSQLSTTDFYNPALRETFTLKAEKSVRNEIAPKGVEIFATLIQRYMFAEKTIDDQIFAKNLQVQTERVNAAASRLAGAKANTERERALWDAKIKDLEVESEAKSHVVASEGSLYEAQKMAEGDLLVAEAKAAVDAERASALSSVEGVDVYLGREIAPLLNTLRGGVVSNIDPYDLGRWMEKLTGKREGR